MQSYDAIIPIEIIPHGTDIPEETTPPSKEFTVGYLGAIGPDKGLVICSKPE